MELPQKLTTDLKIVQHQMKLEIQTHQIMRIKYANDPNNLKLHEDLREIEKRICNLGEKQNQLMKWLRKLLTGIPANNAMMLKTIVSSLGIVNGTHHSLGITPNNKCTNNKSISSSKRNICTLTKDQIQCNGLRTNHENVKESREESSVLSNKMETKDKLKDGETKFNNIPENISQKYRIGKHHIPQNCSEVVRKQIPDNKECLPDPLSMEKEKFLSAVGLVTRDVLKELQNRRVERKRRSTANHTQFVYGSNWDISSKKRKKSNYLTSVSSAAKQHVTRQAVSKVPNPRSETPIVYPKSDQSTAIFKTPLPVCNISQNEHINDTLNTSVSLRTVARVAPIVTSDRSEPVGVTSSEITATVVPESKEEICFICQKSDAKTFACSCRINYHHSCAEIVENCLGCGGKLKSIIAGTSGTKEETSFTGRRRKKEDTTHS